MNLDVKNWKEFHINKVFTHIEYGKITKAGELEDGDDLPYLGAKKDNNGVMQMCADIPDKRSKGNCVVMIGDGEGSVGLANYMESDFLGTVNLVLGYNEEHLNMYTGLFLATVLSKERDRYSFGRKWKIHIPNTIIKLPATETGEPDWRFMEDYIKSLHYKPLTTKNKPGQAMPLNTEKWREFRIGDLFVVELSKGDIKADEADEGNILLISSGEVDNGVIKSIDAAGDGKAQIFEGNKLTVDMFGNAYYQPEPFYAVSHGRVNILTVKFKLNVYIGLFVSSLIKKEQFKHSYGRAIYSNIIADMIIKLPADKDGNPDWKFMEDYIKSLPYGDRLEG